MSDKPRNWRAAIKKAAKKAAKKTVAVAKVAATRRIPPAKPTQYNDGPTAERMRQATVPSMKPKRKRAEDKAMEPIEELQEENKALRQENEALKAKLESATADVSADPPIKWVRGKLPGEKLIKTDPETGKFEEIDRIEWDSLA